MSLFAVCGNARAQQIQIQSNAAGERWLYAPDTSCHATMRRTLAAAQSVRAKNKATAVTVGRLDHDLSLRMKPGAPVRFSVLHDSVFSDGTALPRGTVLTGTVVQTMRATAAQPVSGIAVRIQSANIRGLGPTQVSAMMLGTSLSPEDKAERACMNVVTILGEGCESEMVYRQGNSYWEHHGPYLCSRLPEATLRSGPGDSTLFVRVKKKAYVQSDTQFTMVVAKESAVMTP